MTGVVHLSRELHERLAARAARAFPREACGALFGLRRGADVYLTEAPELANRATGDSAFELDPVELVAVERAAHARGAELLGTWHSHPDRPAIPSRADRGGSWPGAVSLIVPATAAGAGRARAWRACSR